MALVLFLCSLFSILTLPSIGTSPGFLEWKMLRTIGLYRIYTPSAFFYGSFSKFRQKRKTSARGSLKQHTFYKIFEAIKTFFESELKFSETENVGLLCCCLPHFFYTFYVQLELALCSTTIQVQFLIAHYFGRVWNNHYFIII